MHSLIVSIEGYFKNNSSNDIINDFISTTAITISAVALIPQIYQIWTTRSAKDVSLGMLSMLLIISIIQLCYGILTGKHGLPIIITNGISISVRLMVVICKLYMDYMDRKNHPKAQ
jgi:MtN3 and saliva related transmembrane protein